MKPVAIRACKWDGAPCRTYDGYLLEDDGERLICYVPEGAPITNHKRAWTAARSGIHIYFRRQWFDFLEGRAYYYLDIIQPPTFDGHTIRYIDLDLDLIVIDNGVQLLDEDEWQAHRLKFNYPTRVVERAWQAVAEALDWLDARPPTFEAEIDAMRVEADRHYSRLARPV